MSTVGLAERASSVLASRVSRRSFVVRMAIAGSALAVAPLRYLLRPGTAYAVVCDQCGGGGLCCDGYTEFCCVLHGANACPPGTAPKGHVYTTGPTSPIAAPLRASSAACWCVVRSLTRRI